ncbi:EAL domain-containing protein [Thiofaba sp. EF100]|uniref:EAL domain-containing protein n=1 Tax=Thiofaba sp. EF100 TaxID=3121274 RepID=UPI0032213EA3
MTTVSESPTGAAPAPPRQLGSTVNRIAGTAALVLTLAVSALTFVFGYQYQIGALQTEAVLQARLLGETAGGKKVPADLSGLIPLFLRDTLHGGAEHRALLNTRGDTVAKAGQVPRPPVIRHRAPILVEQQVIGVVSLERSLRPLLIVSALMLLPGAFLGFLLYHLLRLYPLRTLRFALQEIAERRQAEDRLQQSLSLFAATLESTADGILVEDGQGRMVVGNQRLMTMWRLPAPIGEIDNEEAWSLILRQLREPNHFLRIRRELAAEPEREGRETLELIDGRVFEWHSRPEWVEGMAIGRVSSFRDVSERRRAEALMAVEKRVLEMVVGGEPISAAMTELARSLEELSGQMFCAILFRESEEATTFSISTGRGLPKTYAEILTAEPSVIPVRCCDARMPMPDLPDILQDGRWATYRRFVGGFDVVPHAVTPIASSSGQFLGLILQHYRPGTSAPPQDAELIRIGNNLASIAIERRQAEERLDHLAHYDPLTGLPNRSLFHERLERALVRANRSGHQVAVMFLDLDRFKMINDTLGHEAGDALLKTVAQRLRTCVRMEDTVARLGGDEFTIILENITHVDDVAQVAHKIIDALAPSMQVSGHEVFATTSIGIALYPNDGVRIEDLLKNADTAMYQAKDRGRNTHQFYSPEMNQRTLEHLELENALRRALERGEFLLHYQPKLDLATGLVCGAEALLRWQRPEVGLVPPGVFVPLLEETGLIDQVGGWLLHAACAQNKAWQDAGLPKVRVAINLSARQFLRTDIEAIVRRALNETGLDPAFIELEVTESMLMLDPGHAAEVLLRIQAMGVTHIDIDDFGTGYSSLAYIKRFPISAVKIDQSFVRGIPHDEEDAAIASAVVAMAHSLRMRAIAEGVENDAQLAYLRALGCDEIQGYHFSRPLTAEAFGELLARQAAGGSEVAGEGFGAEQLPSPLGGEGQGEGG